MNRTPLIRPLRENGATLYVFPSASEDIGLNIDNRVNHVALSHYALLNFPANIGTNITLAEQLQNYVMNCECTLINQPNYNYQEYHTVSERVFWHWAFDKMNIGNLALKTYTTEKTSSGELLKNYYMQIQDNNPDRFVQCFGSIDAGNSLSTEFGMFNETYINIPTSYGNGPVFFNTKAQDVGEQNCVVGNTYSATSENNTLEGRTSEQVDTLKILDNSNPVYDSGTSYEIGYNNGRHTKKAYEIVKDFNLIQTACNEHLNAGVSSDQRKDYIINSYDDINVDSKNQFKDSDYDITSAKCEFTFNAILLYYSVYDQDDPTKSPYAINLFGIIFLNGVKDNVIQGLTKRKSFGSEHTNFFGNSYSFRVNLKTMSVYDNTDAIISDNTTMTSIYSSDFSDVVSNLNRAIDALNTNVQSTMAIQDNYMRILRNNDETREYIENLSTKINALLNGSQTSVLPVNRLCVNEIIPENTEDNMIRITLNRQYSDFIDVSNYQGRPTVSPVIIRNEFEDFNIPTVYMPQISIKDIAEGTLTGTDIDQLNDIIDNTSVLYYRYDQNCIPNMTLPEADIKTLGISNLYSVLNDETYQPALETDSSISYINYNGLIPLMILYIQNLKKEIEDLKQQLLP